MKKVFCIILNYNDYKTTTEQLERIRQFEIFEKIIVVDNASTDDSYIKLRAYETENIVVLKANENGGYGAGNNIGLRYAMSNKAEFALIANPDTIFTEAQIVKMSSYLDNNTNCAVVSILSKKPDGSLSTPIAWKDNNLFNEVMSSCVISNRLMRKKIIVQENDIKNKQGAIQVYAVPGSFLMIHLTGEPLLYDENVFLYCEEKFLGKQVLERNKETILLLDDSYVHNHSVSINKALDEYQKKMIWLNSKKYYIEKKYSLGLLKKRVILWIFLIARLEYKIQSIIRRRIQ